MFNVLIFDYIYDVIWKHIYNPFFFFFFLSCSFKTWLFILLWSTPSFKRGIFKHHKAGFHFIKWHGGNLTFSVAGLWQEKHHLIHRPLTLPFPPQQQLPWKWPCVSHADLICSGGAAHWSKRAVVVLGKLPEVNICDCMNAQQGVA